MLCKWNLFYFGIVVELNYCYIINIMVTLRVKKALFIVHYIFMIINKIEDYMNWINKIAYHQNVRGEEPNKNLAKEISETKNVEALKEISQYLYDKNKSISSDVLATLYNVGYDQPELIAPYLSEFVNLLSSKINRMVWGSMIAISTIAKIKADEVYTHIDLIISTIKNGSLITEVWGLVTLVNTIVGNHEYEEKILPVLLDYLKSCRPIDFAKRVETILPVINNKNKKVTIKDIIDIKRSELSEAQNKKLVTIIKRYNKTCSDDLSI